MHESDSPDPQPTPGRGADLLSIDNVPLQLPIAHLGSRALALLADMVVVFLLLLLGAFGTSMGGMALGIEGGWLVALILFWSFFIQVGYFAGLEIALGGQTLGKRVVGLKVVSRSGGRAGVGALLVRNVFRTLDFVFGAMVMVFDRQGRRLGDHVGGTLVVHLPDDAIDSVRVRRIPVGWGGREVALAEGLLQRAELMDYERAEELAGRLVSKALRQDAALEDPGGGRVAALSQLLDVRYEL